MFNVGDFQRWLRANIERGQKICSPLACVRLLHLAENGEQIVGDWEVSEDVQAASSAVGGVTDEIIESATRDANGLGDMQRYAVVCVHRTGNANLRASRFAFALMGESVALENAGAMSEGPTAKGITTQLMRHNEVQAKTGLEVVRVGFKTIESLMAELREENKQLKAERIPLIKGYEEVISMQHQRNLEAYKEYEANRRKAMIMDQLMRLAPVVVNKIVGSDLLPVVQSPQSQMLEQLLLSLTPDQQQKLAHILQPDQLTAVAEMYNTFEQQKQAREAREMKEQQKHGIVPLPPPMIAPRPNKLPPAVPPVNGASGPAQPPTS